jgi:hypothetical protein
MNKKGLKTKNWVISVLIILTMVMSVFIGIAGAADDNTNPDNTVNENDVDTTKLGAIIGKVVNSEGDPLARVVVYLSSPVSSKPPEDSEQKQVTNERGFFEFSDLRRGEYAIYAKLEGYEPYRDMVKVPASEKVEMKIVLKKIQNEERFSIIYGMVYNALNNKPVGGAIITFMNERSDVQPPKTESDDDGNFKVRIRQGKYVVIAEARGFEPFKDEIVVREKEMRLEIPLKPHRDSEPKPEPKPEPKRPMLSGHIYDAETDRPIYGWVELSYGNPEVYRPMPEKHFDKDLDWNEKEEIEKEELEEREWREKEEWRERKENWEENKEEPKTRQANNEDPEPPERPEKPERPEQPEKPERPPKPEEPERPKQPCRPKSEKPNKPGDYFFWRTFSDRCGFYYYNVVPPGHYEMRVFAPGHKMYYNEITIRDKPQYIDVYLLRQPEPKPWSVIMGQVVDSETKKPVEGAIVCVLPPELIMKLREIKDDDKVEPMGIDLDFDNIQGLDDIDFEIEFEDIPDPDLIMDDPNAEPPMPPDMIDAEGKERDENTRGKDEKDDKDEDCDCRVPTKLRKLFKKFCTKTDERGMFKLRVSPGRHVLIVKAEGYELFARKFEIGPRQLMKVRIPIKPLNDENPNSSENAKPESNTEGSDTVDILGISSGASGTTAALNTTLVTLIIIALILGAMVLYKRRVIPKKKKIQK